MQTSCSWVWQRWASRLVDWQDTEALAGIAEVPVSTAEQLVDALDTEASAAVEEWAVGWLGWMLQQPVLVARVPEAGGTLGLGRTGEVQPAVAAVARKVARAAVESVAYKVA